MEQKTDSLHIRITGWNAFLSMYCIMTVRNCRWCELKRTYCARIEIGRVIARCGFAIYVGNIKTSLRGRSPKRTIWSMDNLLYVIWFDRKPNGARKMMFDLGGITWRCTFEWVGYYVRFLCDKVARDRRQMDEWSRDE